MSLLKTAALAAALTAGATVAAEAQYGGWHGGHGSHHGWNRPAPHAWVPPKVQRKQLELQERFVEKYGVWRQPRHHWGHRPHWRDGYAYGHRPYRYGWDRPHRGYGYSYGYGW